MNPLISVVIPTYNQGEYIQETINSVLNQTYQDFEIIVVDDGSTDATMHKVEEIADQRLKYYYQLNSGLPACTRNKGISMARGKYIAFLDGDDLWLPEKLEKQFKCYKENPRIGLVFTNAISFNSSGDIGKIVRYKQKSLSIFNDLIMRSFMPGLTVMVKRECLDDVGLFNESPTLKAIEDYDLWLRISYKYPVYFLDEPLAKYRLRPGNTSGSIIDSLLRLKEYFKLFSKELPISKRIRIKIWIKVNLLLGIAYLNKAFKGQ